MHTARIRELGQASAAGTHSVPIVEEVFSILEVLTGSAVSG
jgi:hypothetical protein